MTDTFQTPIQLEDLDALIKNQITEETKHFTLVCNLEDCSQDEADAFNMGYGSRSSHMVDEKRSRSEL